MKIEIKKISKLDLKDFYNIKYSGLKPAWTEFNAPYFNEYKYISFEEFSNQDLYLIDNSNILGIFVNKDIKGIVTRYWECKLTKWLEIGIVIFDEKFWNKGIGYDVLKKWIDICFKDFKDIQRVGITTWSGNHAMIKLSEKLGMKQEACIRKVRYYNGIYYDSIKYGILRDEFNNILGVDI